jgi:protein-L-isoaspartate(D-aspartate) O-methyltransferase
MMEKKFEQMRKELVKKLRMQKLITKGEVEMAFLNTPREEFIGPSLVQEAYSDVPLPLGTTGQTISAPHMVAIMLEELELSTRDHVLEIGGGSGYNAALMAYIISDGKRIKGGQVTTIERVPELALFARENIKKISYSEYVKVIEGDGSMGFPAHLEKELYHKIVITAAAPRLPRILIKQLKIGGIILAPIGGSFYQILTKGRKKENGQIDITKSIECVFVPLVGEDGYPEY